jgi:hypothetical protein
MADRVCTLTQSARNHEGLCHSADCCLVIVATALLPPRETEDWPAHARRRCSRDFALTRPSGGTSSPPRSREHTFAGAPNTLTQFEGAGWLSQSSKWILPSSAPLPATRLRSFNSVPK